MAEGSAPEERTEDPTAKRIEQLRKEGTIPVSTSSIFDSWFSSLKIYR